MAGGDREIAFGGGFPDAVAATVDVAGPGFRDEPHVRFGDAGNGRGQALPHLFRAIEVTVAKTGRVRQCAGSCAPGTGPEVKDVAPAGEGEN